MPQSWKLARGGPALKSTASDTSLCSQDAASRAYLARRPQDGSGRAAVVSVGQNQQRRHPQPHSVSAAASRIAANCAPPLVVIAARRHRPPGQRLRAAAEINWRRQRGPGGGGARPDVAASGASTARRAGN